MNAPARIFLVGLPGSGKSTVGRLLAEALNYGFQDLDKRIEAGEQRSIADIFSTDGEARFRDLEKQYLREIQDEQVVIATGGGTPCFYDNMPWMNQYGYTVFIHPPFEVVLTRVENRKHRPLIGDSPRQTLEALYQKRLPYYNQAQATISASSSQEAVANILKSWS